MDGWIGGCLPRQSRSEGARDGVVLVDVPSSCPKIYVRVFLKNFQKKY